MFINDDGNVSTFWWILFTSPAILLALIWVGQITLWAAEIRTGLGAFTVVFGFMFAALTALMGFAAWCDKVGELIEKYDS